MANTIMSAKNSFSEGLIMDFAPDNTQATCMTSALNATLLTFNGNEMSLQNDMGNGRVETARLPQGYIPVGTCEFGDIIYIVSYNPITNKSQIGCFPSPERNISSEEIGQLRQSISAADFQTGIPGEIRATSVKKIIFEKNLNPGDKYIVYSSQELQYSGDKLTDFGNTGHVYGGWPKIVQLHLVAIEDSGKINYLSSSMVQNSDNNPANSTNNSLKWYSNIIPAGGGGSGGGDEEEGGGGGGSDVPPPPPDTSGSIPVTGNAGGRAAMFRMPRLLRMGGTYTGPNDYYIQQIKDNSLGNPDLDSYRNLVDSAYQIFRSKVSGKLAVIAELEKISGFSCTHTVYSEDTGNGQKNFKVYLNTSWITDNVDVNPSGFVVLDSYWKDSDTSGRGSYLRYDWNTQDGSAITETIDLPIQTNTSYLDDRFTFSSAYDLANPGLYDTYINSTCHKKQVELFENIYKNNSDRDLNYAPRKATHILENDIPSFNNNKGKYYINAFSTDKENGIYFVNNEGVKIKVQGDYIQELNDTFVHNYFRKDVIKHFYDLNGIINYYDAGNNTKYYSDLTNLVHTYTVCPAMPYGYLGEYAITNSIDFSKVGSGFINLDEWRYYNDGEVSTLTFGIEAYPEENKGISKVELEFYDNNGKAAVLKLQDRNSYSGNFTEIFQFNSDSNRNLSGEGFTHKGDGPFILPEDSSSEDIQNMEDMVTANIYIDGGTIDGQQVYYINDSGILYPNLLYLVKINIYYQNKNALGEFDDDATIEPVSFTRWYWTNNMYNEYYHNVNDFQNLKIDLRINPEVAFEENDNMTIDNDFLVRNTLPENYSNEYPIALQYLSLGYNKYYIKSDNNRANLRMAIVPSLEESYDTFNINYNVYDSLEYKIWEGESFIDAPTTPSQKTTNNSDFIKYPNLIYPNINKDENGIIKENEELEVPKGEDATQDDFKNWANSLKDWFTLTIQNRTYNGYESIEYVNLQDEVKKTNNNYYVISAKEVKPEDSKLELLLLGDMYSKIMANSVKPQTIPCDLYVPFIQNEYDFEKYNIIKTNVQSVIGGTSNILSFAKIYNISMSDRYGSASCFYGTTSTDGSITQSSEAENFGQTLYGPVSPSEDDVKVSISDVLFANAVDIGPFSLLSVVPKEGSKSSGREGQVENWTMNPAKDFDNNTVAISYTWLNIWGKYGKDYSIQDGSSVDGYEHDTAGATFTYQLVGKDTTGRYIPFNAFGRSVTNSAKVSTQKFGKQSGDNYSQVDIGGYNSFADIIGSFLCQLYYKSTIENTKEINVFDDLVVNDSYTEQWCKEFIIQCQSDNIQEFISILGIPFTDYINGIQNEESGIVSSMWSSINKNNITINTDTILKQANLVQFIHGIGYDSKELVSKYELTQGRVMYMERDISKEYGGTFISDVPKDEILALDFEKNTLSSYRAVQAKKLNWNNDKFWWSAQTENNKLYLSDLATKLTVRDELAYLKNTPLINNRYKGSASSDNWDEGLAQGYNSNIRLNYIFSI